MRPPYHIAAGRALGYLAAWIIMGHPPEYAFSDEHLYMFRCTLADRERCRQELKGLPGAARLFSRERKQRDDEASEPEDEPP